MKLQELDELMGKIVEQAPLETLDNAEVVVESTDNAVYAVQGVSYNPEKNTVTFKLA